MVARNIPIPGFSEDQEKRIQDIFDRLFNDEDLSLITEIPSNMVMHFIRLKIIQGLIDAEEMVGEEGEELNWDPIEIFMDWYMKLMISRDRQGRKEGLVALKSLRQTDDLVGEANA